MHQSNPMDYTVEGFAGECLTIHGLMQFLERLGKRAQVAHCSPHTFRRSFALWSLRAGMSIYALQAIMGIRTGDPAPLPCAG